MSLDVYRDGGSVSASFMSTEAIKQYCLLFPIERSPAFDPELNVYCYKPPVLETYVSTPYTSPITGITSPGFAQESVPLSWPEATALLSSLKPFTASLDPDQFGIYERMTAIATSKGTVLA
jgi:hypothetical protein